MPFGQKKFPNYSLKKKKSRSSLDSISSWGQTVFLISSRRAKPRCCWLTQRPDKQSSDHGAAWRQGRMHHHTGLHGETLPCFLLHFLVMSWAVAYVWQRSYSLLGWNHHSMLSLCAINTQIQFMFSCFLEHVFPKTRGRLVCHVA